MLGVIKKDEAMDKFAVVVVVGIVDNDRHLYQHHPSRHSGVEQWLGVTMVILTTAPNHIAAAVPPYGKVLAVVSDVQLLVGYHPAAADTFASVNDDVDDGVHLYHTLYNSVFVV
jgi:hypothetical protein